MTTVVNNPAPTESNNMVGMVVGILLILVVGFFLFYYGLPMLKQSASPQINVPNQIDVNVKQPSTNK